MTDYTKTTDFTSKDSLPSGDSGKIIRGAEFGTEFDNIQTAVNSKSNIENPSFTGNITVTGTVDGRDIAADGTKLDTIETSADVTDTANVTAAGAVMDSELTNITAVKALNQGVATTDSPTFAAVTSTGNVTVGGTVDGRDVAADGTKLDTVETNADVTDTTNVTAAGALMDSEVTNLAQVKAFDSADYATAAQGTTADNALPKTGGAMTGAITTNSTFDGRDVATDGTKLDGIEASADVTDTANVTAAGALMDSELTSEASVKALNQGVATTDSPTFAGATVNGTVEFDGLSGTGAVTVTDILDQDNMSSNSATALATQQSIKSYVDSQVATSDTLAEVLANGNATGGTDVAFGDNDKALFGAGPDLQIYHSGATSFITENGTGDLRISGNNLLLRSDDLFVQSEDGTANAARFNATTGVTLYRADVAKLATSSTGIDVTGTVMADGLTVDGEGRIEETGAAARFIVSRTDALNVAETASIDLLEGSAGGSFGSANNYGFSIDLDGSNNTLNVLSGNQTAVTKRLSVARDTGDISFFEDTGTTAKFQWSASDESLSLDKTASGVTKALKLYNNTAGANNRVGIDFHTASTLYGTIEAGYGATSPEMNFKVGGVTPSQILKLTSTGIDVSGTVTADGLAVSGDVNISDSVPILRLDSPAVTWSGGEDLGGIDWYTEDTSGSGPAVMARIYSESSGTNALPIPNMIFQTSVADVALKDRMRIDGTGDISFYEDTGTTAKLFWDASAESLGIGEDTPAQKLHLRTSGVNTGARLQVAGGSGRAYDILSTTDGSLTITDANASSERMRIDSSGNVEIKANAGSLSHKFSYNENGGELSLYDNAGVQATLIDQSNNTTRMLELVNGSNMEIGLGSANTTGHIQFKSAGFANAMRIDASGNLLVGKTSAGSSVVGQELRANGYNVFTRDGDTPLELYRKTSDGSLLNFTKDGTVVGSIGANLSRFYIHGSYGSGSGLRFDNASIRPATSTGTSSDDTTDLGAASARFDDIYATNSTIQTSDRNEKQDIEALSDAEQRVAVACKGLLRKFRWKSSVADKGDDARIHFGIIAQDLQDAFTAEGLDAGRYAMFISTTWTDEETGEERTRMGVRYSELLAFIIAAI